MSKGTFSIIVALYGVEKYVESFLQSLERQSFPFRDLEVIIINDETLDGSFEIVKSWASKYPDNVRLASKPNGGPASARNVGLSMASNSWVTFCDPDDALVSSYFENIHNFMQRDSNSLASMITSRVMIWQEETGRISDTHPLARKYFHGERLVDLEYEPNYVQLGGATVFLRRAVIETHKLRMSELIKPTFEDAEFIGRYLGTFKRPIVGLVPSAKYLYRKRGDGSSLVQSGWSKPERYLDVLSHGYLSLLRTLADKDGKTPVWAQNMVIYDLQWYLTEEKKMHSSTGWVRGQLADEFHRLLTQVFYYIDRETIVNFNSIGLSWITRQAMLVHFKGENTDLGSFVHWGSTSRNGQKIGYSFIGNEPQELFEVDGVAVAPNDSKTIAHTYFGVDYFLERNVWLPPGDKLTVRLDGEVALRVPAAAPKWQLASRLNDSLLPANRNGDSFRGPLRNILSEQIPGLNRISSYFEKLDNRVGIERLVSQSGRAASSFNIGRRILARRLSRSRQIAAKSHDSVIRDWATSEEQRRLYRDSWVVMDRPGHADDNGEHLYRYILNNHPEINAWFILHRTSNDWMRLEREGFRLIDPGSKEAVSAVLNSVVQISSDATADVQYPIDRSRFGKFSEHFVFLQHGVTKDDLSRWLNPKRIALIITATSDEYDSIAGDGTPYNYTPRNVCLTGFPRFDKLIALSESGAIDRNKIVIMPTWRQDLTDLLNSADSDEQRAAILQGTEYGMEWLRLIESDELKTLADSQNLEIVYVAHPALSKFIGALPVPKYVKAVTHEEVSLQELFVASRLLITDYSSVAFDTALVGSNICYFQFDAGAIFQGNHNYRQGYFDYSENGFGPLAFDWMEMSELIRDMTATNLKMAPIYRDRVRRTFPHVDQNNSARVTEAIKNSLA